MHFNAKDETGKKYGSWTVLGFSHVAKSRHYYWHVVCDCGTKKTSSGHHLRLGNSNNCRACSSRRSIAKTREQGIRMGHKPKRDLYFIKSGRYVKIGSTDDIDRRFRSLELVNPHDVELLGFYENMGWLEKALHTHLDHSHQHRGEWFDLGEDFSSAHADTLIDAIKDKTNAE